MKKPADDLKRAMKSIHKGLHLYRRAFAALPDHIQKKFDMEETAFNLNAEAGLISDIVIELLR